MTRFLLQPSVAAIAALVTGASLATAQAPSPGLLSSDKGGAPGYQHSLERSRFVTGAEAAALRRVEEHGFAKVVGPGGVFATRLHNGLVVAIPSGGADKGGAGAGGAKETARYVMDPDKHNAQVVDYFVAAGVPRDQLGGVHANTYLSSSGSASEARPAPPKVDGYASILERKIEKHVVADSVAWARLNEEGKVVTEWVYWPSIPAKALADARRLEELAGSEKSDYRARLPAGLPPGKVVIRHSSATADGPFEVFASYDVLVKKTTERAGGKSPEARSPSTVVSVVVRHFDVDGAERRLPQEKRNVGQDSPPKPKSPPLPRSESN